MLVKREDALSITRLDSDTFQDEKTFALAAAAVLPHYHWDQFFTSILDVDRLQLRTIREVYFPEFLLALCSILSEI